MAAGTTYEPIATTTLNGNDTEVIFNSIPQTYTDLIVVVRAWTNHSSAQQIYFQPNQDTGSTYSWIRQYGNGSAAGADRGQSVSNGASGAIVSNSSNDISTTNFYLMNYSNTTTYKTTLYHTNATGTLTAGGAQVWRSTSAVSSLRITIPNAVFISGSTFTLYGIAAA